MKYYLVAILLGLLGLSGCGDSSDPTRANNFTPLTSIEFSAENPQIANLTSTQLRAIGNFSGLFTRDITADVIWASNTPTMATVSNSAGTSGRARGISPGTAAISATLDGITGSFSLTVTNAALQTLDITPLTPTVPVGLTAQFQTTGTFSDATSQELAFDVSWSSSDTAAASISNADSSKGLASALAVGTSTITATFDGTSASTLLTVSTAILNSLTLTPLSPSVLNLSSTQFTATGTFSDGSTLDITDQVVWASSLPVRASISNTTGSQGLVSTLSNGLTTISASLNGISAETILSVTGGELAALRVLPENSSQILVSPSIPIKMTAEGAFSNASRDISAQVTWSSTVPAVASIDSQGVITTVSPGVTEIQAVSGTISGLTNLTVTAATFTPGSLAIAPATADLATLVNNTSRQFTASGDFSDGSTRDLTAVVTWSSSADPVATVSDQGVATAVAAGTASISADFRGLDADSSLLTVTAPSLVSVRIDNLSPSLLPGQSLQLTATATYSDATTQDISADISWDSANTSVALFHDALENRGEILAVDSGSTLITATFAGESDTLTITVP